MAMTAAPLDLLAELGWRGLVQDRSEGFEARLARGPISGYIGFDASAHSLHVGHLLQVLLLTHLQRAGGRPVVVIGGATGMIGDPSGKSSERRLLDDATITQNAAALRAQLERFLDFSGRTGAVMVDNREWLGRYSVIDFLRDIGKHFPVNRMLDKESVKVRLEAGGMSFTEFSYQTLQAADFLHLYRERGVELQMGGADQWGNITAGLELIRRVEGREEGAEPPAFGLCSPLLLNRAGQKMGKSERGAVFLDPSLTSPYQFHQYWLNDDDALVVQHLKWLTLLGPDEIAAIEMKQAERPESRVAQRALARDLTARIHGEEEARRQERVAEVAFASAPLEDPDVLQILWQEPEGFRFTGDETVLAVAVASGLYSSNGEARRAIAQGGFSINGDRAADPAAPVPEPIAGEWLVLRHGRKQLRVGRRHGR
jgi:tyrosyl-tRNA synthetase